MVVTRPLNLDILGREAKVIGSTRGICWLMPWDTDPDPTFDGLGVGWVPVVTLMRSVTPDA